MANHVVGWKTGTTPGSPDVTGIYTESGTYNSKAAYVRGDAAFWIWWSGTAWELSNAKGTTSTGHFQGPGTGTTPLSRIF